MSNARPQIGILARTFSWEERSDCAFGVFASYIECVYAAGGDPIVLPPVSAGAVSKLDGLLLVGGEDPADPSWWSVGQANCPIDEARDAAEKSACIQAKEMNIPTFGICRGAQIINCIAGGQIARFSDGIAHKHSDPNEGTDVEHDVDILQDSALSQLVGGFQKLRVISRHHSFLSTLGKGLRPAAVASDGSIEAFDSTSWTCLGVQWHPEWQSPSVPRDIRPFEWLVQHARERIEG